MNKRILLPALMLPLLILYWSCEETSKKEAVIFFDLSKSLDTSSVHLQAQKLKELMAKLNQEVKVTIYPVSEFLFPEPIYTYSPLPTSEFSTDSVNITAKEFHNKQADSVFRLIKKKSKIKRDLKSEGYLSQSCLINTLNASHSILKNKIRDTISLNVYIFSDMIEDCNAKNTAVMSMCDIENAKEERLLLQIENNRMLDFNLQKIIKNRISVITTSSVLEKIKCIDESKRIKIWKAIFKRVGYNENVFDSIYYGIELPEKIIWDKPHVQ